VEAYFASLEDSCLDASAFVLNVSPTMLGETVNACGMSKWFSLTKSLLVED
jgi:hypothetical protein